MMHDPHLHIEATECDAAPQLGSWWILMVLMLAIMASIAAAALVMLSHVIDAVLSIQWPV
jgi:predicted thioredoxin/glutaredoxin